MRTAESLLIMFYCCLSSTRIGRAEDDEELAREKALQRKRKGTKKVPPVKKSKLGF